MNFLRPSTTPSWTVQKNYKPESKNYWYMSMRDYLRPLEAGVCSVVGIYIAPLLRTKGCQLLCDCSLSLSLSHTHTHTHTHTHSRIVSYFQSYFPIALISAIKDSVICRPRRNFSNLCERQSHCRNTICSSTLIMSVVLLRLLAVRI